MAKYKKVLTVFGVGLLLFATVCGGLYFATGIPQAASQLGKQRQRAKALGLDLTLNAYKTRRRVPDEQNAAITLRAMLTAFELKDTENRKTKTPREEWAAMQRFLPMIEKAKLQPYCLFAYPGKKFSALQFKELSAIRQIVRILVLQADIACADGKLDDFKSCIESAQYFAKISDSNESLFGASVQIATTHKICDQLAISLNRHQTRPEWIESIRALTLKIDDSPNFRKAFQFEMASRAEFIEELRRDRNTFSNLGDVVLIDQTAAAVIRLPRSLDAIESKFLEVHCNILDDLPADEYDYQTSYNVIKKAETSNPTRNLSYFFHDLLFSVAPVVIRNMSARSARKTVLLEAIAYLQGKNPSLSAPTLIGKRHLDTDGKPIRIKTDRPGEVWFYSVGQNANDDGGENNPRKSPPTDDFVVRLRRK